MLTEGPARAGHHWVTLTVATADGRAVTDRIEVPIDWHPGHPNRPPTPTPRITRTVTNPNHGAWTAMDTRTSYRTGCMWHTCPACTTFELVERVNKRRPYDNRTGDPLTKEQMDTIDDPTAIVWMDDWVERRTPQFLTNGDPKPVTGTNLRRFYHDGHEECPDCGWKGEPPDRSTQSQTGKKVGGTGDRPRRRESTDRVTAPPIDRKALLAAYLANRQG